MTSCPVTNDLNAYEAEQSAASSHLEAILREQARSGIDPIQSYQRDILKSRGHIENMLCDFQNSGALVDLFIVILADDPSDQIEAATAARDIIERLALIEAERAASEANGVYFSFEPGMDDTDYQDSLLNLMAYKEELSR